MTQDFFNFTRADLEGYCAAQGHKAVHARDLFRNTYKSLRDDPWQEPSLPRTLARSLAAEFTASPPRLAEAHVSAYDGSVKFLVELVDGGRVEAVLMPESRRMTLCLSSQVGCAQGCVFCHTGRMGLTRDLTTGEIVGQLVAVERWVAEHPEWLAEVRLAAGMRITNVVFMGMGEPLDNVEAVAQALKIFTDPYGLALGLAHISVSTAGHLDGLERLLALVPKARIALSVHAADESQRSRIMPINRRWPLAMVVRRLAELTAGGRGSPVMFQYTMIKGVNDSLEAATRLADLAALLDAKINLIPLNEVSASRLTAPSPERIQEFRDVLHARGLRVMVRYSKGQDIAAACGQLIVKDSPEPTVS